jgi:hypothetical protein
MRAASQPLDLLTAGGQAMQGRTPFGAQAIREMCSAHERLRTQQRAAIRPSGDFVETRDDLVRIACVVAIVEDRVEVESGGALVGREQLA